MTSPPALCSSASTHRYSKRSDSATSATNRPTLSEVMPVKEDENPHCLAYKKVGLSFSHEYDFNFFYFATKMCSLISNINKADHVGCFCTVGMVNKDQIRLARGHQCCTSFVGPQLGVQILTGGFDLLNLSFRLLA